MPARPAKQSPTAPARASGREYTAHRPRECAAALSFLAVLPLHIAAWLLRGIVFQYVGLTAIGAYLHLYRSYAPSAPAVHHFTPAAVRSQ